MKLHDKFYKHASVILIITASILLIPLIAMQYTDEVGWKLGDFIIAGVLIAGSGFTYELLSQKGNNRMYKAALGTALLTAFLMIWINLAVGIIGSEDNTANIMYVGVLAVGFIGVISAKFKPSKMSMAMYAAAAAQIIVTLAALVAGMGNASEILAGNGLFIALWLLSAILFKNSAKIETV